MSIKKWNERWGESKSNTRNKFGMREPINSISFAPDEFETKILDKSTNTFGDVSIVSEHSIVIIPTEKSTSICVTFGGSVSADFSL